MSPDRFKFEPAEYPPEAYNRDALIAKGASKREAKNVVARLKRARVLRSDTYQAVVLDHDGVTELSIRRLDREPMHDWRELQAIKNAVLGPEREACELYPAESRLVDTANQYWLWALPPGQAFPFGFAERRVSDEEQAARFGARQRPLERERLK